MLQVLWERGFINPAKKKEEDDAINGKKDAFGNVTCKTGLKHLMSLLIDFIEEERSLQHHHGRLLGVKVEPTLKCHPGIAGEGVECDWGCPKGVCRCLSISEKRTKSKLRESVRKAMEADLNEALAIKHRRLFSKQAKEHMLACSILDDSEEMGSSEAVVHEQKKPHMTAHLVVKIAKQHKSHFTQQVDNLFTECRLSCKIYYFEILSWKPRTNEEHPTMAVRPSRVCKPSLLS
jgi:hypothetical protein